MQGYLPGEYECLNSSYGSERDLRRCIRVLHANGIKAIADVVLNHRCAGKQVMFRACTLPLRVSLPVTRLLATWMVDAPCQGAINE